MEILGCPESLRDLRGGSRGTVCLDLPLSSSVGFAVYVFVFLNEWGVELHPLVNDLLQRSFSCHFRLVRARMLRSGLGHTSVHTLGHQGLPEGTQRERNFKSPPTAALTASQLAFIPELCDQVSSCLGPHLHLSIS